MKEIRPVKEIAIVLAVSAAFIAVFLFGYVAAGIDGKWADRTMIVRDTANRERAAKNAPRMPMADEFCDCWPACDCKPCNCPAVAARTPPARMPDPSDCSAEEAATLDILAQLRIWRHEVLLAYTPDYELRLILFGPNEAQWEMSLGQWTILGWVLSIPI